MKKYLIVPVIVLLSGLLVQCKKDAVAGPDDEATLLIGKINMLRQKGCNCGTLYMPPVPPLSLNSQLQGAAVNHAKDMAERNYFDHLSPEGINPDERALTAGFKGNFRGENLAKGYNLPEEVITAWKNSTSHCQAMMDAKSKQAGAGTSQNYWVVMFGGAL